MRHVSFLLGVVAWLVLLSSPASAQGTTPYRYVDFYQISNYDYSRREPFDPTPRPVEGTIPAAVRALNGQRISIAGNAMAIDYRSGYMTEFILNASLDACGFGADPRINEWIYVTMAPGLKAQIYTGVELVVSGTFTVKEQIENGRVVNLYSLVADSVK